jgi:hypothetical protein
MEGSGLTFAEAWPNRVVIDFDDLPIWVIALHDLITTK